MPNSPFASLANIKQHIDVLTRNRQQALERIAELEMQNTELRKELEERDAMLAQARLDAEFLSLSHKLADSPEALARARHIIGGLIKKVDAAINLVKNDPAEI